MRLSDCLMAAALLAAAALAAAWLDRVSTHTLSGHAVIADGDSLTLDGKRIRLRGIDAPELRQSCTVGGRPYDCGRSAREHLLQLASGRSVSCRSSERDRYGRHLAYCTAEGRDLGQRMVESGWAIAYGDYQAEEAAARRAGRGLWAGEFERPADWRAAQRIDEAPYSFVAGIFDLLWRLLRGNEGEKTNEAL